MGKRKAFVHVGLDDGSGDFVDGALLTHRRALRELGVRSPAESGEEMFRAALEVLRTHREWGYARSEVEGTWTTVVRRGWKGKDTLLASQPLLASARPEQAALLLDGLAGFETHVVVTAKAPDAWTVPGDPAHDLASVLDRWGRALRRPERLHVVVAGDRATTWKRLGKVVGFGTASLPVVDVPVPAKPRPPQLATGTRAAVLHTLGSTWAELLESGEHPVVGDPAALVPQAVEPAPAEAVVAATERALSDALGELERLTRRNESLELRVETLERKKRKLKRRLAELSDDVA